MIDQISGSISRKISFRAQTKSDESKSDLKHQSKYYRTEIPNLTTKQSYSISRTDSQEANIHKKTRFNSENDKKKEKPKFFIGDSAF